MNAQARPAPARTPFWIAVGLVAGREMKVKMSSKAFVVTTAVVLTEVPEEPYAAVVAMFLPAAAIMATASSSGVSVFST
mgnify:CR=1 FL=1